MKLIVEGNIDYLKDMQYHTARLVAFLYHKLREYRPTEKTYKLYDPKRFLAEYKSDTTLNHFLNDDHVTDIIRTFSEAGGAALSQGWKHLAPYCKGAFLPFPIVKYTLTEDTLTFDNEEYQLSDILGELPENSTKPHKLWIVSKSGEYVVYSKKEIKENGGFETFPLRLSRDEEKKTLSYQDLPEKDEYQNDRGEYFVIRDRDIPRIVKKNPNTTVDDILKAFKHKGYRGLLLELLIQDSPKWLANEKRKLDVMNIKV